MGVKSLECLIKPLQQSDVQTMASAFAVSGQLYQHYFYEQMYEQRCVWIAVVSASIVGYVTLKWHSSYPYFNGHHIPEIMDLYVVPAYRGQGIGSLLLTCAEEKAAERSAAVGLGVGLSADAGPAQRLYIKRGYVPDGNGITYHYEKPFADIPVLVNAHLTLWLIKKIR